MILKDNERLEEVNDSLKLIQRGDGLTFGTDALLLAGYITRGYNYALELGGGTGIVSMLLSARGKARSIDCLEIQPEYAELIDRNANLNGLGDRIRAIECDVREFKPEKEYDLCFSNPPYMKCDSGKRNVSDKKNIARHEVFGGIEDFCLTAAKALKYGGIFACVYRTDRLAELFSAMRASGLEPKRMTFVHADTATPPSVVLVEGKRGAKAGLRVTSPLIIYKEGSRDYTEDMNYIMECGSFPDKYRI